MKLFKKNNILGFVLGAIIFSGITSYAVTKISAEKVKYKDTTIDMALTDLTTNQSATVNSLTTTLNNLKSKTRLVCMTSAWKKGVGWNDAGLSTNHYTDTEYLTQLGGTITVKKSCKLKITAIMINAGATSSAPQYKLYRNNAAITALTNGTTSGASKTSSTTITVSAGDTFYAQMYGGGSNSTYYVTTFELIQS